MSKFKIDYPPGATPIDPNEMNGLIPDYISTQAELNLLEQANILKGEAWANGKKADAILTEQFFRDLHKHMFQDVWSWAGKYRTSEKNIGIPKEKIREEIPKLLGDTRYWIENNTYSWDELSARFHHRVVWIHAFANGNGRHARLLTDVMMIAHGQEPFSWGTSLPAEKFRDEYLKALREADQKRFLMLIKFLKS